MSLYVIFNFILINNCRFSRVNVLSHQVSDLKKHCKGLESVIKRQEHVIDKQKTTPDLALDALNRTFNSDQVDMLLYMKMHPKQWSDKTITESLKTKFVCGTRGYEHQRNKYPIPSERTLQRRMEDLDFSTGILDDVLELLQLKLNTMNSDDLDCGLVFDEMSIEEAKSFCIADSMFYGDVTIPGQNGIASHGLVFMLVGIRSRWKQTVGYHFTGNSIPEHELKGIAFEIIRKVESFGCRVHFLTSDCGPNNKKMWNCLNLKFHKNDVMESDAIEHPMDPLRKLEVMPDVVHVFKSAVQGWLKNEVLWLPLDIVESNGFCTNQINIQHLTDLVYYEHQNALKVAHNLKLADVEFKKKKSNFDAMKVMNSEKYVNRNVSAALRFYSDVANRPEILPTAFFIEACSKWFQLSKNRSMEMALCKSK